MRLRLTQEALADRMAARIAQGSTQSDAFREIKPKSRKWSPQSVAVAASTFASRHNIQQRAAAIRAAMRITDLYPVVQALDDTLRIRDLAISKDNLNAAQALQRQASQINGAIGADTNVVVVVEKVSDAAIIAKLSEGNPELARALQSTLGAKVIDGEATEVDPSSPKLPKP